RLTARERGESLFGDGGEADEVERVRGQLALAAADPSQRRQARVRAHQDHLEDAQRKGRVERLALRDVAERTRRPVELELERAGHDGEEPDDPTQQRGLAGAVGTQQRDEFAGGDLQADVLEDRTLAVAEADVTESQKTQE